MTEILDERAAALAQVANFTVFDQNDLTALYDLYHRFQSHCPVGRSEALGGYWVLTRREHVFTVLRDPVTFSSTIITVPPHCPEIGAPIPIQVDPPEHTKYRHDLQRMFSPTVAASIGEGARARARTTLRQIRDVGRAEAVSQFCEPFPAITFALLVGVPVDALGQLLYWKNVKIRDGFHPDPERRRYVAEVIRPTVVTYFQKLLDLRREQGADAPDDVLRSLTLATFDGRPWTENEILRTIELLMDAGLDTTTSVLARSMHYLATNPQLQQELRADRSLIPQAVEEFLRMFAPLSVARLVTTDVELGGVQLKKGDLVLLVTPAASRDPFDYDRPDEVDLHRGPTRHLAFGAGPHRCLGSHIARVSLTVALEELFEQWPEFRLTAGRTPQFHTGLLLGLDELWLDIGTRKN